jgi:hypothetical protein
VSIDGKVLPLLFQGNEELTQYHRYILRQAVGPNKYFEGFCQFAVGGQSPWYPWSSLQIFITMTSLHVDMSELQRWSTFRDKCEADTLKLDNQTLAALGFTRVHSDF